MKEKAMSTRDKAFDVVEVNANVFRLPRLYGNVSYVFGVEYLFREVVSGFVQLVREKCKIKLKLKSKQQNYSSKGIENG